MKVGGKTRTVPSWSDVKAKLAQFDRPGLVGLLGDLHSLCRENRAFLHARLGLGADPLGAYKRTISRWVYPDIIRNQDVSVAKAKKAITDYRKAIGLPEGLAELSVFYCESAARFSVECSFEDEGFFTSLLRMFDQALIAVMALSPSHRQPLLERLDRVRSISKFGREGRHGRTLGSASVDRLRPGATGLPPKNWRAFLIRLITSGEFDGQDPRRQAATV